MVKLLYDFAIFLHSFSFSLIFFWLNQYDGGKLYHIDLNQKKIQ